MATSSKHMPCAIVTGGAGYLGQTIIAELEKRGWQAVSLSRTPDPKNKRSHVCDITDAKVLASAIKNIARTHGPFSACIHAATSSLERTALLAVSPESFDTSAAVALRGAFLLAKYALPHMTRNSAFIGITTQVLEDSRPQPLGAYVPAKHALRGLLRTLTGELEPQGVRVYAVAPGFLPGGLNNDLPRAVRTFIASKDIASTPEAAADIIADICTKPDMYKSGSSITSPARAVSPL